MIAETIQLALAPVFLLVAIGNILNMLSFRLSRVVDRVREMGERHGATEGAEHDDIVREMRSLDVRIEAINKAMLLLVVSALLTGLTVVSIFLTTSWLAAYWWLDAIFFISALGLLMAALGLFLKEARLASATLRVPTRLLEYDRSL